MRSLFIDTIATFNLTSDCVLLDSSVAICIKGEPQYNVNRAEVFWRSPSTSKHSFPHRLILCIYLHIYPFCIAWHHTLATDNVWQEHINRPYPHQGGGTVYLCTFVCGEMLPSIWQAAATGIFTHGCMLWHTYSFVCYHRNYYPTSLTESSHMLSLDSLHIL